MIESLDSEIFVPLTEEEAEVVIGSTKGADLGVDGSPAGPDGHGDVHLDTQ